jgi:hypothetical protein
MIRVCRWKLDSHYVRLFTVLPRPDPRRAASFAASKGNSTQKSNLVDQYTALVLAIFIDAGLVEVGRPARSAMACVTLTLHQLRHSQVL